VRGAWPAREAASLCTLLTGLRASGRDKNIWAEGSDKRASAQHLRPNFQPIYQVDVARKDRAATLWCENATVLAGIPWRYLKVPQKHYEKLQPADFADLQTPKGDVMTARIVDLRSSKHVRAPQPGLTPRVFRTTQHTQWRLSQ